MVPLGPLLGELVYDTTYASLALRRILTIDTCHYVASWGKGGIVMTAF